MFNGRIIEVGQKLVKIRKIILRVSQGDLAGEYLSTSQISKIERGESILTNEAATKIYENILKIGKDKDIDIEFTFDDFIETAEEQTTKAFKKIIEEYNIYRFENHEDKFWEKEIKKIKYILSINTNYREKAICSEMISEIYLKLNNVDENIVYTSIGFEMYIKINDNEKAVGLLTESLKHYKVNYQGMINIAKLSYILYNDYNLDDKIMLKKILYNISLCYNRLNNWSESIIYLEKLLNSNIIFTDSEILDINVLNACCLMYLGSYDKSLSINLENLKRATDLSKPVIISRIYINLAELYRLKSDFVMANFYTDKSLLIKSISIEDYSITLYSACINYIEIKNVPLLIENIYSALRLLKKIDDYESIEKLLKKTVIYLNQYNNVDAMDNFNQRLNTMFRDKFFIANGKLYTESKAVC